VLSCQKKCLLIAVLSLLVLLVSPAVFAQAPERNPFMQGSKPEQALQSETPTSPDSNTNPTKAEASNGESGNFSPVAFFGKLQRDLNKTLGDLVHKVQPQENGPFNPWALLVVLGVSFLYGIVHGLGPGHGKAVAGSFFMSRPASIRQGLSLGYLIAAIHAIVATSSVLLIIVVLQFLFSASFPVLTNVTSVISAFLVIVLGLFMAGGAVVELVTRGRVHGHVHLGGHDHHHQHNDDEDHEHDDCHNHAEHETVNIDQPVRLRELVLLAFVTAIIPCPGAVTLMVFSVSLGLIPVGILAVAALSLGMGLTTSAAGIVLILVRRGMIQAGTRVSKTFPQTLARIVRIAGSLLLAAIGVGLLFGALA